MGYSFSLRYMSNRKSALLRAQRKQTYRLEYKRQDISPLDFVTNRHSSSCGPDNDGYTAAQDSWNLSPSKYGKDRR